MVFHGRGFLDYALYILLQMKSLILSLIMIDEPTEGLSPQMVGNVEKLLKKIAEKGVSILLVEQKLTIAFNFSV